MSMLIAGWLALSASVLVTGLAFQGLIGFSNEGPDWTLLGDDYFQQILLFSLKQALLSALLSVLFAWPVARALYYLPGLPGRRAFLALCLLCFVMPTLVLITGLVALLGHSGLLSPLISALSGERWNLYGLSGILLAHLFLNMPFAVRVLFLQLQAIPDSGWKLALQLKLSRWQRLRLVEWPGVRSSLLMLFGFIFVLCFNSFAIVLALGGGPRSTTLEVAIYQALKYDFNIPETLTLAWTQLLIAGGLFLLVTRLGSPAWLAVDTAVRHWTPEPGRALRRLHQGVYALSWLCLSLPILALLPGLVQGDLQRFEPGELLLPALTTLGLGLVAAIGGMLLAYALLKPIRMAAIRGQGRKLVVLEWLATHHLVAPAMVVSVGLFVFLLPRMDLDRWGMLWVALLNMLLVVPFAVQKLKPRLLQFDRQYDALAQSLKLRGLALWRIEWPFVRPVTLSTFALVLVLAMGDVAIFSIFGTQDWITLPWLIYGYAGSYRIAEASLASLLLLVLCALALWGVGRLGHAQTTHRQQNLSRRQRRPAALPADERAENLPEDNHHA